MDEAMQAFAVYMKEHKLDLNLWYRDETDKWYICIVDVHAKTLFQDMGRSLPALISEASVALARWGYPHLQDVPAAGALPTIHGELEPIVRPQCERSLIDRWAARKRWAQAVQQELQMPDHQFVRSWIERGSKAFAPQQQQVARRLWLQAPPECKAEHSRP